MIFVVLFDKICGHFSEIQRELDVKNVRYEYSTPATTDQSDGRIINNKGQTTNTPSNAEYLFVVCLLLRMLLGIGLNELLGDMLENFRLSDLVDKLLSIGVLEGFVPKWVGTIR